MKRHLTIVFIIVAALSAILVYLSLRIDLIPFPSSVERQSIDNFVKILFAIASVFFSIVVVVFTYSLIFFRRRRGETGEGQPLKGNAWLERAWTLTPLAIVLILAAFGGVVLNNITYAGPAGSELEIDVTAQRYSWSFFYPAYNISSFELRVPVNQRLYLKMQSKDVVHSFWVQQWGPKQDLVPGMITEVRYTPTQIGQFLVQCSQLCGAGHTYMTAPVAVTSLSDFQTWVQQQPKGSPIPSSPTASPTASPSSSSPSAGAATVINLTAQNLAFDMNTITVPVGVPITINFNNKDNGIPHNFAVYTDSSAANVIFRGQIVTGPATAQYIFTTTKTPGSYFFRCDVHPTIMTGQFIVK